MHASQIKLDLVAFDEDEKTIKIKMESIAPSTKWTIGHTMHVSMKLKFAEVVTPAFGSEDGVTMSSRSRRNVHQCLRSTGGRVSQCTSSSDSDTCAAPRRLSTMVPILFAPLLESSSVS